LQSCRPLLPKKLSEFFGDEENYGEGLHSTNMAEVDSILLTNLRSCGVRIGDNVKSIKLMVGKHPELFVAACARCLNVISAGERSAFPQKLPTDKSRSFRMCQVRGAAVLQGAYRLLLSLLSRN
jgi:hypothetical protein